MSKRVRSDLSIIAEKEKAKREAESVIANTEKAKHTDELVIAREEKTELADELIIANAEKAKLEDELVVANEEKADREAELVIAIEEKEKRAADLVIANEEKEKRAAELVIANVEKTKRAAELVIANAEKAKRAADLVIANLEKEKRADELIIADKELTYQNEEKVKRAAELVIADINKTKREAELVIAKIEKAKRIAKSNIAYKELSFQTEEKSKRAAELVIADAEKEKRSAELVIANIKKAKRSAELVIANVEKAKRSAELVIANKELVYQKSEKSKRAAELIIANVEKAKRAAEFVIANIDKSKRAAEFVVMNKELVLAKEKEKLVAELTLVNKELTIQITERKQSEKALFESEERFRLLFNQAPLGYQALDFDGNFMEVNQTWLDILGYKRAEVIGKWFGSFLSPPYKDVFCKRFPIFKAEGKIHSEFEMVHKNGNKIFIAFEGRIGYDNNGEFKQTHCILQDITERRQWVDALQKSDAKYNAMISNISDIIGIMGADGKVKYRSPNIEKWFGWQPKDLIGTDSFSNVHPDDLERVKKEFSAILEKENSSITSEYKYRCKDGSYKEVEMTIKNLTNDPFINGVLLNYHDITERKRLNEKLQNSESYLKETQVIANLGAYTLDITSGKWKSSEILDNIFGIDSDYDKSVEGWASITHPEWQKTMTDYFLNEVIGNKTKFDKEYKIIRKNDKAERWVHGTGSLKFNGNDQPITMIGTIQDITEQMKTNEILVKAKAVAEENEERFRNLFENSPIGKSMAGIDGSLRVNKSFCEIVGYSEEELRGKKMADITHPEDLQLTNEKLQSLLNSEAEKVFFEKRYIQKNGNIVWVDVSTYLQRDKENKPQFFITTIIDTTAHKNFENELIKAKEKAEESDRLKSAFLANMSHEIRTPMNGIIGFTELLKEPNLSTDDQQDFIQTIQISGERMLNTINNIVDISKIESGLINVAIDETNINEKIEFTYKFFKPEVERKGLQFKYKNGLLTKDAVIRTDNEKVYGVLTNLIKNAIKFTYDGSIEFGYEKKGAFIEFYVRDMGVGIPQNQKEFIFERFRQGSNDLNRLYEGSGLGLSISKSYVEMLGGRIWVESEEGLGSTFYFTIPYNSLSEEKTIIEHVVSAGESKDAQLNNLKILIVEDDEISYSLLLRTIQKFSKEVLHAITGVQAVEACRNNPDIDLVLMDIRMPQMNGLEATQQIRKFDEKVIIIAQTAYGFSGDREKAIKAGCNDYISKPINKTLLYELIKKHCTK